MNLGTQSEELMGKSYTAFVSELRRCEARALPAPRAAHPERKGSEHWNLAKF